MSNPYAERYNRTLTISLTERQFNHLQDYCIKNMVSLSSALRESFFLLHPMLNERNDTLAKVTSRSKRIIHTQRV